MTDIGFLFTSAEEPLLPEVKEERTRRSHFVQGLVLSLIFDEIL
jgi:E3 ubiquitin-protein ligase KCMF1